MKRGSPDRKLKEIWEQWGGIGRERRRSLRGVRGEVARHVIPRDPELVWTVGVCGCQAFVCTLKNVKHLDLIPSYYNL